MVDVNETCDMIRITAGNFEDFVVVLLWHLKHSMVFSLNSPKLLLSTYKGQFSLQRHYILNVSWCPQGAGECDCDFQMNLMGSRYYTG